MTKVFFAALALTAAAITMAPAARATDLNYMAYDPTLPQTEQLALRKNMGEKNLENSVLAQNLKEKGKIEEQDGDLNLIAPASGDPEAPEHDQYDHFMGHN